MIDIVICTFKRLDKQITFNNIPESYRDNVTLVVQPQEAEDASKVHKKIFVQILEYVRYEIGMNYINLRKNKSILE